MFKKKAQIEKEENSRFVKRTLEKQKRTLDSLLNNFRVTGTTQKSATDTFGREFKYELGASLFEETKLQENAVELLIERIILLDNSGEEKVVVVEFLDFEETVFKNNLNGELNMQRTFPFDDFEEFEEEQFSVSIVEGEKRLNSVFDLKGLIDRNTKINGRGDVACVVLESALITNEEQKKEGYIDFRLRFKRPYKKMERRK